MRGPKACKRARILLHQHHIRLLLGLGTYQKRPLNFSFRSRPNKVVYKETNAKHKIFTKENPAGPRIAQRKKRNRNAHHAGTGITMLSKERDILTTSLLKLATHKGPV